MGMREYPASDDFRRMFCLDDPHGRRIISRHTNLRTRPIGPPAEEPVSPNLALGDLKSKANDQQHVHGREGAQNARKGSRAPANVRHQSGGDDPQGDEHEAQAEFSPQRDPADD